MIMKTKMIFIVSLLIILFSSCKKFLEEDYLSGENSFTAVETEDGMESLVNSVYTSLRVWYGKENSYDLTEAGTDLYTFGKDLYAPSFCTYSILGNHDAERVQGTWFEFYAAINTCNLILANIDKTPYSSESIKQSRKGEIEFMRAHFYWLIAEIWGGVHFTLIPVETASKEVYRSPISTFYEQIFKDLESAENLVPETTAEYGRITKDIVKALNAKVSLMWAGYLEHGFTINGQTLVTPDAALAHYYYQQSSKYATELASLGTYKLESNYSDIWNIDNIHNSEVIWAINYSDDPKYTQTNLKNPWGNGSYDLSVLPQMDGGHTAHLLYEIRIENLSRGNQRDIINGRGYQRWMPTKFLINLFDETVDQRFYGSFKHVWLANMKSTIPKWKSTMIIDGEEVQVADSLVGRRMFAEGDTSVVFYKNPVPTSKKAKFAESDRHYFNPKKGYLMIDINDMYLPDGSPNDAIINRQYYFPITMKYRDTTRLDKMQRYSKRDTYAFRISEMYLIAAEAELMLGNSSEAYNNLEILASARAIGITGNELLSAYGINSPADIDIDFILDERARELASEQTRFWDLKRTGKLIERVKAHNPDAAINIQEFNQLRFIPQIQLDAVINKADFPQNPGW